MTDDELEQRLRRALRDDASQITPTDRWDRIHAMSEQQQDHEAGVRPRWLAPVAAAAAVALIAGGAFALTRGGGHPSSGPAASGPTTTAAMTSPGSTAAATTTARPSGPSQAVAPATVAVTLPAYFVGPNGGNGDRWGLYREFLKGQVRTGAGDADRAKAALKLAMNAQPFSNTDGYLQPWSGTTVTAVSVTPSQILVTLSNKGASGFTKEQTRLAVQELVWTAQAAVGASTPVRFAIADGSTSMFGTWPTSKAYDRPPADQTFEDLATLWITAPGRDAVLPAGSAVVVKGQSCSFEGASQWQLKKGSAVVRSGHTQATSGCPTRGTWAVNLGPLAAGQYTFRAYERDMQSGTTTVGDTSRTFSVK